ncbi:alkane 1-monooxygenase [Ferrimonas senticii]|uniref:alkane 1-monooxygenase n=1 Tax=Ferrimonas senticii TaxID=394566 RepID=UPI0006872501|nr:alkane 1-monooxygenase [Ferrimonas senticii]
MWRYLTMYLLLVPQLLGLLIGGWGWLLGPTTTVAVLVLGEALLGDDLTPATIKPSRLADGLLYLALPLMLLLMLVTLWALTPGDMLGLGAWLAGVIDYPFVAAKQQTPWWLIPAALQGSGLMLASLGTIVGHELCHRAGQPLAQVVSRWLLAFSCDTAFAIEHVYGHHRWLGSDNDPATAPRGRNVYQHIWRSSWFGNLSAWRIEAKRLALRRLPRLSWHNRYLRGQAMSLTLLALAYLLANWQGALVFVACALIAKAYLEIVNYMEHYGLVRDPCKPVQPRHSWNSNNRISGWATFNLTRHSHHHAKAQLPFEQLQPLVQTPMMPAGYMTTILLTLIPPLWRRVMAPRLAQWDREFASDQERQLLQQKGWLSQP